MRAAAVLAVLLVATPVAAQPSMTPPAAPPGPPAASPDDADTDVAPAQKLVESDAASGRAYLSPTGFTAPKGTVGVQVWAPALPAVVFAAATYSVTSRLEVSAGGVAVLDDHDAETASYLSARVQVLRRPTGAIAVQVQRIAASVDDGDDAFTLATAAASKCVRSCRTVLTAHVSLLPDRYRVYMGDTYEDRFRMHAVVGGSLVTGGRTKLVVDAVAIGEGRERAYAVYGGVRFARRKLSADVGLVGVSEGDETMVLPLPIGGVAFRF